MATRGRWAAVTLGQALLATLLGCPSLGAIGVGDGDRDAGVDQTSDVAHDTRADAPSDGGSHTDTRPLGCTHDAASDPKNCGRCGHDCQGGACEGGVCQAYAIVTGNEGPYGVAVNDGVVYFTSIDMTVEKCMADACSDTLTQMTTGQQIPRRITTDTTNVYWASEGYVLDGGLGGSIATCGLAGCSGGMATVLAFPQEGPSDLAVSAGTVYWTAAYGKAVRSCAVSGCDGMPTTLASPAATDLSGMAVDSTSIYWTEPMLGNVLACPLGGCSNPTTLATGQATPQEVDVANGTLFWSVSNAVMSCETSACGVPNVFAKNQTNAFALAHDETNLYWTLKGEGEGGAVLSCALSGCTTPTVLATMQGAPTSVAVDATAVYWADSSSGTVMRLMK